MVSLATLFSALPLPLKALVICLASFFCSLSSALFNTREKRRNAQEPRMPTEDTTILVSKNHDGSLRIIAGAPRAHELAAAHGGMLPRSALRAAHFTIEQLPDPVALSTIAPPNVHG